MSIGSGIAIIGIWVGTGIALAMGCAPEVAFGSTVATVFVAIFGGE